MAQIENSKTLEYACRDIVFHFNKKFLEDPTIPMWVLKFHGKTLYVNHVDCNVPWSTKETEGNAHTKGSIKIKEVLLQIDSDNNATLTKLTLFDKIRLRNQKLGITRIMFTPFSDLHKALQSNDYKHSPFKNIHGSCSSSFVICDILKEAEMTILALRFAGHFRVLAPNETYYQEYDKSQDGNISVDYSDKDTPYEYS